MHRPPARSISLWLLAATVVVLAVVACSSPEEVRIDGLHPTDLAPDEFSAAAFGEEFPLHYESYLRNMERGGPTVSKLTVEVEPNLPILWANLPFSVDYNFPRGHTFAVDDVISTLRISDASIGSCMTCKSSTVPLLLDEFGEDYWAASFREEIEPAMVALAADRGSDELGEFGHVSVGCSDCHDPETMQLRITRPSLTRALEGQGIDILEASRNDMRSLVCAQCHVEYYFYPGTREVVFPWNLGTEPDQMYAYFETIALEAGFEADWIHGISGAPMLKAQHPEYELWSYGTHGQAGVSCADCHMPYQRLDGVKMTTHVWGSPLDTVEQSCRTCHADQTAGELRDRVGLIQNRHLDAMHETQDLSVDAHYYVNRMITAGADPQRIAEAQQAVRRGQWFWDIIAAENSDGFHNAQGGMDAMRMSSDASNEAIRIATAELARLGVDLEELREQIDLIKQEVYDEDDPARKHELVTNEFFPSQAP